MAVRVVLHRKFVETDFNLTEYFTCGQVSGMYEQKKTTRNMEDDIQSEQRETQKSCNLYGL